MKYQYIDIFAGCGGLSLGLYNSGWKGVFAIEKNTDAFETLQHNLIHNKKHFEWVDWLPIQNHDINEILQQYHNELKAVSTSISLVVGGPPCQGFSMAGQRNQSDFRNQLVYSYIEFIKLVKPLYLFFENVQGFTVGFIQENKQKTLPMSEYIIEELRKIGYDISSKVLDLSEYGIPQKRKRFILIGSLKQKSSVFFDILNTQKEDFFKMKNISPYNFVHDAIGDLLQNNQSVECPDSKGFLSGYYSEITSNYQKLMRKGSKDTSIPNSHRFSKHKIETVQLFKKIYSECAHGKRLSKKNVDIEGFNRRGITILIPDSPCNTITSHPDDYLHYIEPRVLTVRESARIQSFPDWYHFKGKYTTGGTLRKVDVPRYTQVGNAIPPLFAEQVGLALIKFMETE